MRRPFVHFVKIFLLFPLLILSSNKVFPQNTGLVPELTPFEEGAAGVKRFFFPINPNQPFEGAINPANYTVGPNDIFSISVGGLRPQVEHIPVSADGYLILLGKKSLLVAGRPLDEVSKEAERLLNTLFPRDAVDIKLLQPRSFFVHVSGSVANPGRLIANPLARLDEVVRKAIHEANPDQKQLYWEYRPSIRSIRIDRSDGSTMNVDLYRYFMLGETDQNPLLLDDDRIYVASHHIVDGVIHAQGTIPFPGPYPFREDDTLIRILEIITGTTDLNSMKEVIVTRTDPAGRLTSTEYDVREILDGRVQDVRLLPGDRVHVPDYTYNAGYVFIDGEVKYPGPFLVRGGKTTLRQVYEAAGGPRDEALLRAAYIERAQDISDETSPWVIPRLENEPVLVQRGRLSDLDLASRLYLERELLLNKRIAVNVATAVLPEAPEIYLYPGDRLIIPRDRNKVQVIGEVTRPGFVEYRANQTADYYIAQAEGRGARATDVYIIDAASGQLLDAYQNQIQSGDVLFVDRADLADTQELQVLELQRQNLKAQRTSLILSAVTTATVVVSIVLRIFGN